MLPYSEGAAITEGAKIIMDLQTIQNIEFLENNKILLDGLRLQYKHLKRSGGQNDSPDMVNRFVSQQWANCSQKAHAEDKAYTYRMQDPFVDFYMFIDREAEYHRELLEYYIKKKRITMDELGCAPTNRDAVVCWNTDMLRFYARVEKIQENENSHLELPDGYEDLCNILAALMGSNMCYIFHMHQSDIYMLAHSAIPLREGGITPIEMLTSQDFQLILGVLKQPDAERNSVAETVYQMDLTKREREADDLHEEMPEDMREKEGQEGDVFWLSTRKRFPILVLRMQPPSNRMAGGCDELCLVFQYNTVVEAEEDSPCRLDISYPSISPFELWKARNILVLRQSLLEIVLRDRFVLLTAQKEYQYVKPLTCNSLSRKRPLRILHLTDLHIQKSNYLNILNLIKGDTFSNAPLIQNGIDLLFITGDVVQGWNNAGELEANYKYASHIIRCLVSVLWGRNGKLRADWQKRLVIIPGNHDYASMNELEVISENGSRATGIGRPSQKEGGPMVKFAYYEEFLCELLGADIGQMNRLGLNEYRDYSAMNLHVVGLNTSVDAGPLRNNKVSLFEPFIQSVQALHHSHEAVQTIWLGHHTARYVPNYSVDRYYCSKIQDEQRMEQLVERFRNIITSFEPREIAKMSLKKKCQIQRDLDLLYMDLAQNNPPLVPEQDAFMADVLFFKQNWLSAKNEQCNSIRNAALREMQMEQVDAEFCMGKYMELYGTSKPCLMLGGHIHEIRMKECCYEGDKFYVKDPSGEELLNYAVLELDPLNTHSWRSCQIIHNAGSNQISYKLIADATKFSLHTPNGLDLEKLWNT